MSCDCPWCDIADLMLQYDVHLEWPDGPPSHEWELQDDD